MNSKKIIEKLFNIAVKQQEIITKLAQTGFIQTQQDIGSGESQAIKNTMGPQIAPLLTPLQDKALYIEFNAIVDAPNFMARSVNLESVEVYAGFDEPEKAMAETASQKVMQFKSNIEATLLKFYKTPAGIAILKNSGSPPSFKVVFKWKLK